MSNERVFTPSNKLKSYSVKIGEVNLVLDVIISLEVSFRNDTPKVLAKLIFDDLYDMNNQVDWFDITIDVSYVDMKSVFTEKTFKVIDIREYEHSNYKKAIELKLQDTFSYGLEQSFISKGFNSTLTSALNQYITHIGIDDYDTEFTNSGITESFTVPKNKNNLEFFIEKFKQIGFYFYQSRDAVILKSLDDLDVDKLEENDDVFTNETDNQYYKNKIIASRTNFNNRNNVLPKIRSFSYNKDTKKINYDLTNDKSIFSLNDDLNDIQDNLGYKDVYQQHSNFNEHDRMIRDSFISQNKIEIVVNGFAKNVVNQIYDVQLRGNQSTAETQINGNTIVNGKYISKKVIDKIVGDSFIQKIYLERADAKSKI